MELRFKSLILIAASLLLSLAALAQGAQVSGLENTRVVILGDSNTWFGGDDCRDPRGWTCEWARLTAPLSCRSYARSGATWTNTPQTRVNTEEVTGRLGNDNTIFNQLMRLKNDLESHATEVPDMVIIAAGTNDIWFHDHRPDLMNTTAQQAMAIPEEDILACQPGELTTLAEAMRYCCELIEELAPEATVVILTPMQFTKADPKLFAEATALMEELSGLMELEVVRQDTELEINAATERARLTLTKDGVHPTPEGAARNGRYLAGRIAAMARKN